MFSFFSRKGPTTAYINSVAVTVNPNETLLQAALRNGIDFPHSCRVGGCATCKCRLIEGQVKELTQTAYILSDEDLDQGCILACQSVPKTDVRIEVDLSRQAAKRRISGRVLGQDKLTHDIVRLRVQLDESLPYKAGQYAEIALASQPDVKRSYSFATPPRADAQATFFVRKVPGGAFSSRIYDEALVGQGITIEGALGDFWLRPSPAPLLLVGGGSGLAPLLAMLSEALDARVERPALLLFGARTQADLYALDTIDAIAKDWRGGFRFIPVLSAEAAGSDWTGRRGLVADLIPEALVPGAHAYLCGPPPMVDAAQSLLTRAGVPREHIHADRFTTLHDAAVAVPA
ncbi:MAG: 2Fe-2S iron-sulfur cluster binding domain-containing protein [Burkholderiales bacterium]|nr:2Fe-2S iron-sulfur cluster binding domain-containing protein [Burkholderiales bacterium]